MKTILIIEDDDNLGRGIAFSFERDGYNVVSANTIMQAKHLFAQYPVDLIILDIGLPDGDGVTFCREIRQSSDIPIIMLTARDLETDEVSGLMAGADDYITKPFSLSVLHARVETVLRRLEAKETHVIRSGRYELDINGFKLFKDREEISLSATEFRLIKFLMSNAGQILSKEQILAALWDHQGNFVDENTLSVNISRVRSKIEDDPKAPKTLKTVHGIGYVWGKE